ncbi:MAG: hypothetical protein PHD67_08205 [Oscillospiraceae bacterium]|nr:hypothetical protein [Oscillospiraceae bacterium]
MFCYCSPVRPGLSKVYYLGLTSGICDVEEQGPVLTYGVEMLDDERHPLLRLDDISPDWETANRFLDLCCLRKANEFTIDELLYDYLCGYLPPKERLCPFSSGGASFRP